MVARALFLLGLPSLVAAKTVVLIGATGQTGIPTYAELKKLSGVTVRAIVRNATKAKSVLGCDKCDESEGIFEGDVTKPESMEAAFKGADALVSALGSAATCKFGPFGCSYHEGATPKDINWLGNKNAAVALAKAGGKQVVLMSTMGTTKPDNFLDKLGNGHVSFYSLQAEAWLVGSGLDFTVVKACGLVNGEAGKHKFVVGHDDNRFNMLASVPRADVARVMAHAIVDPEGTKGLRFDLCTALLGKPTGPGDVEEVYQEALMPWDSRKKAESQLVV